MEPLGHVGYLKSRFGPFRDSVSVAQKSCSSPFRDSVSVGPR
jgi:hypothetical protein